MSDEAVPALPKSGHVCLGCGCTIMAGEYEVKLNLTGKHKGRVRYKHATQDGCADALRRPARNVARVGKYRAIEP